MNSKNKTTEALMDAVAILMEAEDALKPILAEADQEAARHLAADAILQEAYELSGAIVQFESGVDKDSYAIRAHRSLDKLRRAEFAQVHGARTRALIPPLSARLTTCRERIKALLGALK